MEFAALDFGAVAGGAVAFGLFVVIPAVAILTEHQRKMARILHGMTDKRGEVETSDSSQIVIGLHAKSGDRKKNQESNNEVLDEIRSLRGELADLRMQVASLQGNQQKLPPIPVDQLQDRLTQSP